jgi:anti-sigma-K factor RskA
VLRAGLACLSTAPSPRDALAAEHVVGVLDAHGAAEVDVLQLADPAWRAAITAWERYLAPLSLLARPETPPGNIWERIAARAQPRRAPPPPPAPPRRAGAVLTWAILANLAAAGLAGYMLYPRSQAAPDGGAEQ